MAVQLKPATLLAALFTMREVTPALVPDLWLRIGRVIGALLVAEAAPLVLQTVLAQAIMLALTPVTLPVGAVPQAVAAPTLAPPTCAMLVVVELTFRLTRRLPELSSW